MAASGGLPLGGLSVQEKEARKRKYLEDRAKYQSKFDFYEDLVEQGFRDGIGDEKLKLAMTNRDTFMALVRDIDQKIEGQLTVDGLHVAGTNCVR